MDSQSPDTSDSSFQNLAESLRDNIRVRTNGGIRSLEVTINGDSVVISGRTSRYYYKQLATSAVLATVDQRELTNQIQVERDVSSPDQ